MSWSGTFSVTKLEEWWEGRERAESRKECQQVVVSSQEEHVSGAFENGPEASLRAEAQSLNSGFWACCPSLTRGRSG